ncbi:MAG: CheB methylesterase, partial [Verrucomicrobiaceae bacterium]|nr:CheB methylesterase [Verrucomicrobiaceae bacterium]
MEVRQIIVIGGSAGSFEPLKLILSSLSENLDASIFIVIHTSGEREHTLDKVLGRSSLLPVRNAQDDEPFQKGVYLAPSDRHLTISASGVTRVARGPKENRFRPAIDPLFRSAAIAFGPSVTGVILSGALDDGSAGLWAIKSQGGTTIVQNPEDAVIPFMPLNAIKNVQPHHCVPAQEIASLLISGGASRLAGRLNHSAYHKTMETEIK